MTELALALLLLANGGQMAQPAEDAPIVAIGMAAAEAHIVSLDHDARLIYAPRLDSIVIGARDLHSGCLVAVKWRRDTGNLEPMTETECPR